MDTSKIIRGIVNGRNYTVTSPIVKEDYGLVLQIEGVELPPTYQVDFSNSESNGTSVTMIGNSDGVLIPRQFIDSGKDIFAFLYHVGADFGRTVYKFRIPNKVRPDRTNEEPTPEEQSVIDQAISALNSAVAQTAQDVIDADASAQSASDDADRAEEAKTDAQNYASSANTSSDAAYRSASSAQLFASQAETSAQTAEQIKDDVESMVDDAQGYATASAQSASASANSASDAQGYAQGASASAQSASGYATQAQTSAQTASAKASEASTSASTASAKATESAQSASQALTYKTDAESAKTASQTAQGLAESARDSAISAKNDAEDARDEAQSIVDGISGKVEQIDSNTERIESLENDRYKPYPTDTASGAVASFVDGADDIPLKSCIVQIEPVQDLHGYDHPWVGGGGKNLFDADNPNVVEGYIGASSFSDGNSKAKTVYIAISPNTTYTVSKMKGERFTIATSPNIPANNVSFSVRNANNVATSLTITSGANDAYLWVWVYLQDTDTVPLNDMLASVQIEEGSTATAWSPYENICPISGWTEVNVNHSDADTTNPTTITINLGQTVYGGKLDVLSGELVVDRAMVTVDGVDENWSAGSYSNFYLLDNIGIISNNANAPMVLANNLKAIAYINRGSETSPCIFENPQNYIELRNLSALSVTTVQELKSWLGQNNLQVVYPLATPITIQLTPQQVNSLLGVNNIWADSGDTEVEYRADTKLYIERLTAPDSADMIADANITSGQYFMVGNSLYKATANIANGSAIIVGTNCTRKSLSEALNEINA